MDYFEGVFQTLLEGRKIDTHTLSIAGHTISLKFTGTSLQDKILPAFSKNNLYKQGVKKNSDFTIILSADKEIPSPTKKGCIINKRGEITGISNENVLAAFQRGINTLNLYDKKKSLAILCINNADDFPYYEKSSPLKFILNWYFSEHHLHLLHAAALGNENGAVLITAKGGSGKSTTAVNGLLSGMHYLSDDYCLCKIGSQPMVYNLYDTAKLTKESLHFFPELFDRYNKHHNWQEEEKKVLYTSDVCSTKRSNSYSLKAILVPEIMNKKNSEIEHLSSLKALRAMAPTSIFQMPHIGKRDFKRMKYLTTKVPTYKLKLGRDMKQNSAIITDLLNAL